MNAIRTVIMAMIVTFLAIGMTGFAAAMNTNVQYTGDGAYDCRYDAYGAGSIEIRTYTDDGYDMLRSDWQNTEASGWQEMDTYSGTAYNTDYDGTVIKRSATVGGADEGEMEAGSVNTYTTDEEGNHIFADAVYYDNRGYGSHVTLGQTVVVGTLDDVMESGYDVTGVAAITSIDGYAYGGRTLVGGQVSTYSGDAYTSTGVQMYNGRMHFWSIGAAASVDPALWGMYDGAAGQIVYVDARGKGTFYADAGYDMHGMEFYMTETRGNNVNTIDFESYGTDEHVDMDTDFRGRFTANGYVYAIDLP